MATPIQKGDSVLILQGDFEDVIGTVETDLGTALMVRVSTLRRVMVPRAYCLPVTPATQEWVIRAAKQGLPARVVQ